MDRNIIQTQLIPRFSTFVFIQNKVIKSVFKLTHMLNYLFLAERIKVKVLLRIEKVKVKLLLLGVKEKTTNIPKTMKWNISIKSCRASK